MDSQKVRKMALDTWAYGIDPRFPLDSFMAGYWREQALLLAQLAVAIETGDMIEQTDLRGRIDGSIIESLA